MKRALTWYGVFLALSAACGDDGAMTDSTGTTGVDGTSTSGDSTTSSSTSASTSSTSGGSTDTTGGSTTDDTGTTSGGSTGTTGDTGDTTGGSTGDTGTTGGVIPDPGELDHAGGQPAASFLVGNRAYVAAGPRVTIWDVSDPDNATLVGQSDPLPGLVTGIAVRSTRAYVSVRYDLEGSVHVLDVTDPMAPSYVASVDYLANQPKVPTDVLVEGGFLFVSDTESGIHSFEMTDPDAPALVDTHAVFGVGGLDAAGGLIRYTVKSFIGGFDVGTIEHTDGVMTELGYASLPDQGLALAFAGNRVYQSGFFGFFVYDLSDPDLPTTVYSDGTVGRAVNASDAAAYLFSDSGLTAYDGGAIVSPGLTVLSPTLRTVASSRTTTTLLGATDLGFGLLFDVSQPLVPIASGVFDLPVGTDPTAVAFSGDTLVVSDFYTGIRVSDAADWSSRGRFHIHGDQVAAEDVAIDGSLAYIADWGSGLYVVDISDPDDPTWVGHVATGGAPSAVGLSGTYAFVGESTGGGAVRVVDVSDPASPAVVGSIATTKVRDLEVVGDLVYVADEQLFQTGGMRIIDVSNPQVPAELAHYTTCQSALGVAVEGTRAYVACAGDESLHVVDVSNPAQPVLQQTVDAGATGTSAVAVGPDRVWLGHAYGITEIDNTDPDDPQVIHDYGTAMLVRRIAVDPEGTVYAAAGPGGVYRIEFTN